MRRKNVFIALSILLLIIAYNSANAASATELKEGETYRLLGNATSFKPVNSKHCNLHSSTASSECLATSGSVFRVTKINTTSKEIQIVFRVVVPLDIEHLGCQSNIPFAGSIDTPFCKEVSKSLKGNIDKVVGEKFQFKYDIDKLSAISIPYEPFFTIGIKAILVPQKIYSGNYQHSSDPTIGIGISGSGKADKNSGFNLVTSATYGLGFNQLGIDTPDGIEERMGLSLFFGYDFKSVDSDLGFGVYFGKDFVQLSDGEKFAGRTDKKRSWLGLVLSADLK